MFRNVRKMENLSDISICAIWKGAGRDYAKQQYPKLRPILEQHFVTPDEFPTDLNPSSTITGVQFYRNVLPCLRHYQTYTTTNIIDHENYFRALLVADNLSTVIAGQPWFMPLFGNWFGNVPCFKILQMISSLPLSQEEGLDLFLALPNGMEYWSAILFECIKGIQKLFRNLRKSKPLDFSVTPKMLNLYKKGFELYGKRGIGCLETSDDGLDSDDSDHPDSTADAWHQLNQMARSLTWIRHVQEFRHYYLTIPFGPFNRLEEYYEENGLPNQPFLAEVVHDPHRFDASSESD